MALFNFEAQKRAKCFAIVIVDFMTASLPHTSTLQND